MPSGLAVLPVCGQAELAPAQLWVSCSLLCSQLGNAAACLLSLQAT